MNKCDYRRKLVNRIEHKRKQIEELKKTDNYLDHAKAIWIDGQIFELQNVLMDLHLLDCNTHRIQYGGVEDGG